MKHKLIIFICIFSFSIAGLYAQDDYFKRYSFEFSGGAKVPMGITKNDIVSGLSFRLGLGYMLSKKFELAHFGLELGTSSPHDPDMLVIQDYYSYGRVTMEKVLFFGAPLTTRFHFNLNEYFDAFVGGGGAFYWFSSRLEDPYYGEIKDPRSRNGFGGLLMAGLNTNLFSEKFLVTLKTDFAVLNTSGKTLSIRKEEDIERKVSRKDKYLTISIGMRYTFNRGE